MGCSSSREGLGIISPPKRRGPGLESPPPSIPRTLSLPAPLVHHPPLRKGDTHHLVSLISTTYGSLHIDPQPENSPESSFSDHSFCRKLQQPETINAWELMEDLEETPRSPAGKFIDRSFTFHGATAALRRRLKSYSFESENPNSGDESKPYPFERSNSGKGSKPYPFEQANSGTGSKSYPFEPENSIQESKPYFLEPENSNCFNASKHYAFESNSPKESKENSVEETKLSESEQSRSFESLNSSKPLWMHLSEESLLADMDPNVVSSFRKASVSRTVSNSKSFCNSPKQQQSLNQPRTRAICSSKVSPLDKQIQPAKSLPGSEDKIVFYFTSLRGIRRTYEDCCNCRLILQGFRVPVDERDISMDSAYRKELQSVLGEKNWTLPQIFIRGRHIGGAEEIKQLHEIGELGKLFEGFPLQEIGFVCESCGDVRFVPCLNCYGSRKVFTEDGELQRCLECNENGLIRCPACCC